MELATFCNLVIRVTRVIVTMKIIMSIKIRRGGVEPATMSTPHPLLAPKGGLAMVRLAAIFLLLRTLEVIFLLARTLEVIF